MLSTIELKEIKQQIDKGYSVSFPDTSIKDYVIICKQIDNYIEQINNSYLYNIEEI
jgi:hypothetical protein